ncbi:MAG: 50S ribosome-binding GTPase [Synergistaceae bacterium]|nr:50S ribosome-binding GTPase [Synergistaceae bacterium]
MDGSFVIALAGQPNCGKSTVFNLLTVSSAPAAAWRRLWPLRAFHRPGLQADGLRRSLAFSISDGHRREASPGRFLAGAPFPGARRRRGHVSQFRPRLHSDLPHSLRRHRRP